MVARFWRIYRLGIKELWALWRDPAMLLLIVYVFTVSVYTSATAMPETLHQAAIAVVDDDRSALSDRLVDAFQPPQFRPPVRLAWDQIDAALDAGRVTFVLAIPAGLQRDLLAGKAAEVQLNVDATRMSQAFTGSGYVQQLVSDEVRTFLQREAAAAPVPVDLVLRARFNPALEPAWFGSLMEIIDAVAMLSIILTGAALIREREHGTIEHLLVMPVSPFEIMAAKIWAMGLVVLLATAVSLGLVVRLLLQVPIQGSVVLFLAGAGLCVFAATSLGIFLATLARSMPQFALLLILTIMPMQMLSGGMTPREGMPELVQGVMALAPTTHFVDLGQAILYRGAGLATVWPAFVALAAIGSVMFLLALARFRKALARMA